MDIKASPQRSTFKPQLSRSVGSKPLETKRKEVEMKSIAEGSAIDTSVPIPRPTIQVAHTDSSTSLSSVSLSSVSEEKTSKESDAEPNQPLDRSKQLSPTEKDLRIKKSVGKTGMFRGIDAVMKLASFIKLEWLMPAPRFEQQRAKAWMQDVNDSCPKESKALLKKLIPNGSLRSSVSILDGFLDNFRNAWDVATKNNNKEQMKALGKIAAAMRGKHKEFNQTFSRQLKESKKSGQDYMTVESSFQFRKKTVDKAESRMRGAQGFLFDPASYNLPHEVASLKVNSQSVSVLRMGTPTVEGSGFGKNNCKLTPEYTAFLYNLREEGKVHLDVVKQRRVGSEGPRTQARIEASQEEFRGTLVTICLPDDGNLYEQTGFFESETMESGKFFSEATRYILTSEEFYIPETLNNAVNQKTIGDAFKSIHQSFFGSKDPLNKADRKAMIDMVYAHIEKMALEGSEATSVNFTCKDGIDRGAVATRIFLEMSGSRNTETDALYVSGAVQAKGQTPIKHRDDRYRLFLEKYNPEGSFKLHPELLFGDKSESNFTVSNKRPKSSLAIKFLKIITPDFLNRILP